MSTKKVGKCSIGGEPLALQEGRVIKIVPLSTMQVDLNEEKKGREGYSPQLIKACLKLLEQRGATYKAVCDLCPQYIKPKSENTITYNCESGQPILVRNGVPFAPVQSLTPQLKCLGNPVHENKIGTRLSCLKCMKLRSPKRNS